MGLLARWGTLGRQWFLRECTRLLTRPLLSYEVRVPNNPEELRGVLQKGDILLVEGDQRVSQVIRYLTQSSWSHSALYVGDELLRERYGQRDTLLDRFGRDASALLIEANVGEGVIAAPLAKYRKFNLRICRPYQLHREDLETIMADVISHLGDRYDLQHVLDLARFFFPVSLVPRRWRRAALHLGSGREHEVICSSMIARAFARIGYPILPQVKIEGIAPARPWWRQVPFRTTQRLNARFTERDPAFVTPRDFDLSPYFRIVKIHHLGTSHFSYRDITWENALGQRESDDSAMSA